MSSNTESKVHENVSLNSNEFSTDEQHLQTIDSANISMINENMPNDESLSTTINRTSGQTAIGAKIIEKLEKIGILSNKIFLFNKNIILF